jgi:hypothetical protein
MFTKARELDLCARKEKIAVFVGSLFMLMNLRQKW